MPNENANLKVILVTKEVRELLKQKRMIPREPLYSVAERLLLGKKLGESTQ